MILRGANDYMLDEMERALHDALSIVKRTLESNTVVKIINEMQNGFFRIIMQVVPSRMFYFLVMNTTHVARQVVAGGGAVEAALSVYLEYLATTLGSREQLAIAEFADSLLIIPKVIDII